ncbi:MAG: YidC/Oxa1 family membrane protein insertase [Endomicrobium sp.]|nr:YidC/Oxa1 family membrane protein insertase [Endomicrobium sp.]
MTELEALKQRAKELGKKPDKKFVEVAKAIDRMREIFKEAGLSPFKEYMKDKHGK